MKNGQTGPRTAEGKSIAAQNARKHSILSECPVIPGVEQAEDWEAHRAAVYESFQPVGFLEASFVERVALSFWRLNRITRHEREVIAETHREWDTCAEDGWSYKQWLKTRDYYQALARLMAEFSRLEDETPLEPAHVHTIIATLCKRLPDSELRRIRILEVRVALAEVKYFPKWTADLFRRALQELSGVLNTSYEVLRKTAAEFAESELAEAQGTVEMLETQRRQAQSHAHIPGPEEQARICRYEAHLSRELYRALHALEALQSRRTRGQAHAGQPEAARQPPAVPVTPPPPDAPALPDARRKTKDADAPTAEPPSRRIASTVATSDPSGTAAASPAGGQPAPGSAPFPQTTAPITADHTPGEPARSPIRDSLNRVRALLTTSGPH